MASTFWARRLPQSQPPLFLQASQRPRTGSCLAPRPQPRRPSRPTPRSERASEQQRRLRWLQPTWLRAAAAVVLIAGGVVLARSIGPTLPAHPAHYVAEDLNGLSATELRDVLNGLDQTLQNAPARSDAGLDELSPEQLKAVLRSLEG